MDLDEYVAQRRHALFRFAVVLTGDPVLADDVVAEALARAVEHWHRVRSAENVHAYVRKIVLNEYLSWRRRFGHVSPRSDVAELLPPVADPAEAHAVHHELVTELRRLPPKQRAALVLRYYEGLPYAEIAHLLGSGENTVRSNVSRALATLRIQLVADADASHSELPQEART